MADKHDELKNAIRELVAQMYQDLTPAEVYYEGDYEAEIERVTRAIRKSCNKAARQ